MTNLLESLDWAPIVFIAFWAISIMICSKRIKAVVPKKPNAK